MVSLGIHVPSTFDPHEQPADRMAYSRELRGW